MNASHDVREQIAREAYEALGTTPSDSLVLQVQCGRSHHIGGVYATERGTIFHSLLHAKAHGRRDRYDGAHHGHTLGVDWYDILDPGSGPGVDDDLPAGCECGPYTLSRRLLIKHLTAGETRIVLD